MNLKGKQAACLFVMFYLLITQVKMNMEFGLMVAWRGNSLTAGRIR